jgi:Flp pilus assembly protein TadG
MKRLIKEEIGATLVEGTIALPVFFVSVFTGLWVMMLCINFIQLTNAVNSAARFGSIAEGSASSRAQAIRDELIRLKPSVNQSDIKICRATNPNCLSDEAGSGGEEIVVKARLNVPMLWASSLAELSASSVVLNEPDIT